MGLLTTVDTSSAGFTTPPNYFAEVTAGDMPKDFVPAWFTSIDGATAGSFTVRLLTRGIARETFSIVDPMAQVTARPDLNGPITIDHDAFGRFDRVSRLLPIGESASTIKSLSANGTNATVQPPLAISNAKLFALGNPPRVAQVNKIEDGGLKIELHSENVANAAQQYREGDLVAKLSPVGFSDAVRVEKQLDSSTITLKDPIAGLTIGDTIASADFRVRATVLGFDGTTVTLSNASLFPLNSLVARLDDDYKTSGHATVTDSRSSNTLTLGKGIDQLNPGDILALCAFPTIVNVDNVASDRMTITVTAATPGAAINSGDAVAALPAHLGIAIVSGATGGSLQLATPIDGLTDGDQLSVVTVGGVVKATPDASGTLTLDANDRVRLGDFLAEISGWRDAG